MATREKFRYYSALSDRTLRDLTTRRGEWQSFLNTAARLYKYSFQDQVMIFAQKPGATACAEIPLWNEQFKRSVRRGTKGIALIDDSGSYPDLKYVFDVSDTEALRCNARPVRLWEMSAEYKPLILAELAKNYEDVDGDSLGATFRNIAKQLATEYYNDNRREILYQAENSALEPPDAYRYDTPIDMVDDSELSAVFVETLSASAAYSIMTRCGLDPSEYFDDEDFRSIIDFNTPTMANALGAATADVSEQVLRDIELTIRKHERVKAAQMAKNAERSENEYDRNPYLQPSGGLPASQHQAERTAEGGNAAPRQVRQNEESVPQRTPQDNVQPNVAVGDAVSAPAGGGRTGDGAIGAGDEVAYRAEQPARQGSGTVGVGGGDERAESPSGGNGAERTDLRGLSEPEPPTPPEAAQEQAEPSELQKPDGFSLPETAETPAVAVRHRYYSTQRPISIGTYPRDGGEPLEIQSFDTRTPVENGAFQAWGWLEYDKPLTDKQARDYELRYVPPQLTIDRPDAPETISQLGKSSLDEILSTSAISLAEVDSILRDGGNDKDSYLRIAARFAKAHTPGEQTAFIRREYLQGGSVYRRNWERESGKGFDFGNHRVSAWFDKDGISLAVGATARTNIHRVTLSWENVAARVNELIQAGEYVDRATFDDALDNERLELAGKLWFFYRDDMHFLPEEWEVGHGYPEDEASIKALLDDPDERQAILDRLETDVVQFNADDHDRVWFDNKTLLENMRESMLPTTLFANGEYQYKRDFQGFITQDEIDAYLTNGETDTRLKTLSHYLTGNGNKDFVAYLKDSFGEYGGGSHALGGANNSWGEHSRGKGIKLSRGTIGDPYAEVKLNPAQAAKRVKTLIESGQFVTRADLNAIGSYEKLILTRAVNTFFAGLPEEYARPFPGKAGFNSNEFTNEDGERTLNFYYPHEEEWNAINGLLDNPENVHALLARMEPIYVNTPEEDRYYDLRKRGWDYLNDWYEGKFTLFPGVEHLPDPETALPQKVAASMREVQPREDVIDLGERVPFDRQIQPSAPAVQLSMFDTMAQNELPILPSEDEQRKVIDDSLRLEAREIENRENEPFLSVSNEDKARLYEAFADNPRSRAAVNLVREIYGDTLGMPLPQAVQKITELVEAGLMDGLGDPYNLFDNVRDELTGRGYLVSGEVIEDGINLFRTQVGHGEFAEVADFIVDEYLSEEAELGDEPNPELRLTAVGDFYELYGDDAQIAVDVLGLTLTSRDGEPMVGFPKRVFDDYAEQLADEGYTLLLPETADVTKETPSYKVGDMLMFGGKLHEITKIEDFVTVENRDLDHPAEYAVFDRVAVPRGEFEAALTSGELKIEPPQDVQPEAVEAEREAEQPAATEPVIHRLVPLYEGVTADINGIKMVFSGTDGTNVSYREVGSRDVAENYREISIYDLAQTGHYFDNSEPNAIIIGGGIPIFNANRTNAPSIYGYITNEQGEDWYVDRDGSWLSKTEWQRVKEREQAQAAQEIVAHAEAQIAEALSNEPETAAKPAPQLDFDDVKYDVYDLVMADADFAEVLKTAQSRGAIRAPLTAALDKAVGELKGESGAYANFFTDDVTDALFDYVYKTAWEYRPTTAERTREILYSLVDKMRTGELLYSDVNHAAAVLGLKLAEFGDQSPENHYGAAAYAYWNKSGDRRADADIRVDYNFDDNGKAEKAKSIEIDYPAFGVEPPAPTQFEQEQEAYNREQAAERAARFRETWKDVLEPQPQPEAAQGAEKPITPTTDNTAPDAVETTLSPDVAVAQAYADFEAVKNGTMKLDVIKLESYEGKYRATGLDALVLHDLYNVDEFKNAAHGLPYTTGVERMPRFEVADMLLARELAQKAGYVIELDGQKLEVVRQPHGTNFRITDDHLGEGGAKTKYRWNAEAIQTVKTLEREMRNATPAEQDKLSRYVGWGGLPQAFDPGNSDWAKEYAELSKLLTPEEFDSARASTLNAHYTSPTVIRAMWETIERLGFTSGNVLEPSMGVGNFFGLVPEDLRRSKLYGVELDGITARIAQKLYPNANIQQKGFEKTEFSDAFFDVAVGNVPFGSYGVLDPKYDKLNLSIHNYFFAKTLDKVRPGGVMAFVTSKFTMDEKTPKFRKYLAERVELLGAVRLPNTAFLKNAGTETTMDILFLQKRDRPLDIEPEWVHLGLTEDGIPVNRYFLDNPEMVCGKMALDEHMNNKFGRNDYTCCLPTEGADLGEQLENALALVQGEITLEELEDLEGVDNHAIPADYDVKNFSYTLVGGNVYFRENSLMYPVDLPAATLDRIKGMVGLRDCVNRLIELQLDEFPDSAIERQQATLNTLYDKFNADFGLINSTANNRAFSADSAYYLLSSLEMLNEDGELDRKADMFTKRTIKQKSVISHVDTASEALAVSLGERACVDLAYMADLTGKDEQTLFNELRGVVFLDLPENPGGAARYVTADEFLSGNVREKLAVYSRMAQIVPDDHEHRNAILDNAEALKAVQPKDLEPSEIAVRMGATWINPQYIEQFMYELLKTPLYSRSIYQVKYHEVTGEWQVTGKGKSQFSDVAATVTYGTKRMNAYQIIDDTLNLRDVRVYDIKTDADGKDHRVLNKKETMLAQQRQELIKQAFKDWIWKDPERRQTLTKLYNETFNSIRPREYDGSHLVLTGMNPEYTMRPYQLNATARGIYGGNTLLAHEVGAGKTFTMTAIAMESKRLGLCQKSLFAVPNHLTEQWAAEILRLYPSANILVATKKDFEMRNRKKFCAKIATGDYDAVIIGHSQLEKIPLSKERQTRLLYEQLDEIENGIRELKDNKGERFSIKQLEKTKRNLEVKLSKLLEAKQKDDVVTFEQLGCDRLFIDESHNFKNLFMYTKMRNVAGLSTSEAAKSTDLFMKCRYLDELTGGKGVTFATGTPVSNSMTELYTVQRYLQHDTLSAMNLNHFDAWASIFGETQTSIELAPEGTGYRARTRFAKFHNLPELMTMFRDVADIQTADMLKLPVPEVKYENVIVEPSETQKEMVEELSERAARVHAKEVDATEDNMLKITTDGRKIGLDQRLMNPLTEDFEGSKVNACTDNVFRIWNDTAADRLTQLVFCDFSTPNKDKFNVYDDIKAKLIERGIPEAEIAFIHDADTETRKKELFAKVRQGKVRVLFGSTFKMGAGTNVQDKLIAIHDADCPWRPADLAQRAGRIVRFGNNNAEVQIYRYATSGTFDSYLWQTVQKKQEFIAQIMSSKSPMRSCDDVDETALSYAEIKALCAGNPLIAEKMSLDNDVAKLRMLKSEHNSQHYRLEDDILKTYPQQILGATARISGIEQDLAAYAVEKAKCSEVVMVNGAASASVKFAPMTINGVTHVEKEPAAKALLEACKGVKGRNIDTPIGDYMGFKLSLQYENFGQNINLYLRGAMTYKVELSTDAFGNITRINNALDKLQERLDGAKENLANAEKQMAAAKEELAKPFTLEDELAAKSARLALLNADLNIDGDGDYDVINDTESRDDSETERSQDERGDDDRDEDDFDEPDDELPASRYGSPQIVVGTVPPPTNYGTRQPDQSDYGQRTGTYGKARPSILDDLDTATKAVKPPVQGGGKSAEIDI
jgi:N12 class adenine-specific DNA methylase